MKATFIATVLNEEKTVGALLESLACQTVLPDEVVIVDGGSTDKTVVKIKKQKAKSKNTNQKLKIKLIIKPGNRATGRNEAVRNVKNEIILCSDAGCVLDKNWVKNLTRRFTENIEVVSGYYRGKTENIFQKCLVPYVLVMPDKLKAESFLPSSRSMAFKKSIWVKAGGFPENLNVSEDYAFAHNLVKSGARMAFAKDAFVYWQSASSLKDAFRMFRGMTMCDIQAGIVRPKMILVMLRYLSGLTLLLLAIYLGSIPLFIMILLSVILYIIWAIAKNYRYVNDFRACFILPVLQFTADLAVLTGTLRMCLKYNLRNRIGF